MTKNQWYFIMVFTCVLFMASTSIFGVVLGSIIGAGILGAAVAYGADKPGGTGWK